MKPSNRHTARSASRAAWSLTLGFGGVTGQRVMGIAAPAPI
jgi:hypothetical protein